MSRLSDTDRAANEAAIRAAMDRLLRGEIPPGGRCDLKTLATMAGVNRTGFYPKGDRRGPYQYLAEEFERRLRVLQEAGDIPDPRDAQITMLKDEVSRLKQRLAGNKGRLEELTDFKTLAVSRLAAQHAEIERLRRSADRGGAVRELRRQGSPLIGPC